MAEMTEKELRELDAQVHREVMAWGKYSTVNVMAPAPRYSSDIAAAWQVVEKMRDSDIGFVLGSNGCAHQITAWFIDGIWSLGKPQNVVPDYDDKRLFGSSTANTAPIAISRAALAAVRSMPQAAVIDDAAPWHPHCERCGCDLPDDAPVLTCADCLKELRGGS